MARILSFLWVFRSRVILKEVLLDRVMMDCSGFRISRFIFVMRRCPNHRLCRQSDGLAAPGKFTGHKFHLVSRYLHSR